MWFKPVLYNIVKSLPLKFCVRSGVCWQGYLGSLIRCLSHAAWSGVVPSWLAVVKLTLVHPKKVNFAHRMHYNKLYLLQSFHFPFLFASASLIHSFFFHRFIFFIIQAEAVCISIQCAEPPAGAICSSAAMMLQLLFLSFVSNQEGPFTSFPAYYILCCILWGRNETQCDHCKVGPERDCLQQGIAPKYPYSHPTPCTICR